MGDAATGVRESKSTARKQGEGLLLAALQRSVGRGKKEQGGRVYQDRMKGTPRRRMSIFYDCTSEPGDIVHKEYAPEPLGLLLHLMDLSNVDGEVNW